MAYNQSYKVMPLRGFGTNGFEGEHAVASVARFLKLGGRLLDTGVLYNNHAEILRSGERKGGF